MYDIYIKENVNTPTVTTIKIKSAKLTNVYCTYFRRCGYHPSISRMSDGYAIKISGLNSDTAHKLIRIITNKIRLLRQNAQTQTQKVA